MPCAGEINQVVNPRVPLRFTLGGAAAPLRTPFYPNFLPGILADNLLPFAQPDPIVSLLPGFRFTLGWSAAPLLRAIFLWFSAGDSYR